MTTVPDGMPSLAAGKHKEGSGETCVMEYISVIAGEKFSDRPSCTNQAIASAARMVNDQLHDEDRHLLVPLIGRLASAGVNNLTLLRKLAETAKPNHVHQMVVGLPPLPMVMWQIESEAVNRVRPWDVASMRGGYTPEAGVAYLTELLDIYDEYVKGIQPMTTEAVEATRSLMGAPKVHA